jgi:hypothetical protein
MTRFKTIAVLALATLAASTSLTHAEAIIKLPDKPVVAAGGPYIPIIVLPEPDEEDDPTLFIPLDIDFPVPEAPLEPIKPGTFGFGDPEPRPRLTPETKTILLVDCQVKDTAPVTDDMWLVNDGTAELPAGLKLKFSIPSTGDRGALQLERSIAAGHRVKVPGLLDSVPSGALCRVQIIA